jgi:hypothetical protein
MMHVGRLAGLQPLLYGCMGTLMSLDCEAAALCEMYDKPTANLVTPFRVADAFN